MAEFQKILVKNVSDGPRGVHGRNGLVLIEQGKSAPVELNEGELNSAEATGYFKFGEADDDDAGDDLSKLKRDELVQIATDEGVEFDEKATRAQLIEAIEAKRAENA